MKKRIIVLTILVSLMLTFFVTPASAQPPSTAYFTTGLAADAGYYMEYYSNGSWKDLKTPQHWEKNTGDIAYCLDQTKEYPVGTQSYTRFSPSSVYSERTIQGLYAILGYGYPNTTGGLPDDMARYSTANAVRAWLAESEGIGYNFMNISNGYIRAKEGSPWAYSWMKGLLSLARDGNNPLDWSGREITTSPGSIELEEAGGQYSATFTVSLPYGISSYSIDSSKLPTGTVIQGYTGSGNDTITVTLPAGYSGTSNTFEDVFIGKSTLSTSNVYWYQSGNYQPIVAVDFSKSVTVVSSDLTLNAPSGGYIEITKYGETALSTLSGAVFAIYRESDGVQVDVVTTGADGKAVSQRLPEGTYSIQEMSAPDGYLLDGTMHTGYVIEADATLAVNFSDDKPEGVIRIQKTNANPELGDYSLVGAVFEISEESGSLIDTVTTNEAGCAESKNLPLGTYAIKETQAPEGYVINTDTFSILLDYQNQSTPIVYADVEVPQTPQAGQIEIKKQNANPEQGDYSLEGAVFEIIDARGTVVDTIATDASGLAISEALPLGEYTVQEIQAPEGYALNTDVFSVTLAYDDQTQAVVTSEIEVENTPQVATITIVKRDREKGSTPQGDADLSGVGYAIYTDAGELIQTLESTGDTVTSEQLPLGTYLVKEIKAPAGYLVNPSTFLVEIMYSSQEEAVQNVQMAIGDEVIKGSITIHKTGNLTGQLKPDLEGAVYEIKLISTGEVVDTVTTDRNGIAQSIDLPYGEYLVTETAAPSGYLIGEDVTVFIEENETAYTLELEDEPTMVTIAKASAFDGTPLAGTEISVYAADDQRAESIATAVTDTDGNAYFYTLPIGSYSFIETKAPEGYTLSTEAYSFSIDSEGEVTGTTSLVNEPLTLKIEKVKYEDNAPLSGAGFTAKGALGISTYTFTQNSGGVYTYDEEGEITEVLVDANGEAVIYGLPAGTYWMEETTVPNGYYPSAAQKVTISEDDGMDNPYVITIPNSVYVKLGHDYRKIVYAGTGGVLILLGLTAFFIIKRKRGKTK